jgi:cytochrome c-type biogenesis protein CcmH
MPSRLFTSATPLRASTPGGAHLRRLWIGAAASLLLIGVIGYSWLGAKETGAVSPSGPVARSADASATLLEALSPAVEHDPLAQAESRVSAMVDGLADRMKTRPDDAEGWQVLGRSYASLGRQADAIAAFRHAAALRPKDRKLRAEMTRLATRKTAPKPPAVADRRLAARWTPVANAPEAPLVAVDVDTLRSSVNGVASIAPPWRAEAGFPTPSRQAFGD